MKVTNWIWSISVLLCFGLIACKSNQEEKALSLDDISKSSTVYNESDSVQKQVIIKANYFDSVSIASQNLIDSLKLNQNSIHLLDTIIFPDRFGAASSEKWYSSSPKDSLVFMKWTFQTVLKAENALFNWLDCFGLKCRAIPMGTNTYFSKRGTLILCNEKELYFIESSKKLDEISWLEKIKSNSKRKEWKFFIVQQPNRKIEWKTIDSEGEWMDYNQKIDLP